MDLFSFTELIIIFVLIFLGGLWTYARWNYGTLEKMGIPVVRYTNPILGSARDLYDNVRGLQDVKWMRKYGNVFGVYEGRRAVVYVCDPELVRLITVRDVDHFNAKSPGNFGDPIMNEMPSFLPTDRWRLVRSLTTPAFSSAKLKLMSLPIRQATQDFISDIRDKIHQSGRKGVLQKFAIDQSIHFMLTDLISRALFSIQIKGRADGENEFAKIAREALVPAKPKMGKEMAIYSHAFPFLKKLFSQTFFQPEPVQKFVTIFKQMMDERRRSQEKRNDLVDMCLEWWDKLDTPEFQQVRITELTLLSQVFVFFMAGQDQMSTMVGAVIYHMTGDKDLTRRIYKEVDKIFDKYDGKIEEEHLPQLVLLNSCISECIRLYGVFHRTGRLCSKDWKNEEFDLELKKGTPIVLPFWALNRNEEYVENPDGFDPERFLPENKHKLHPYASSSFGFGPRRCSGERFATLIMPLILVYLLKEFEFVGREDTQLKFLEGGIIMSLHEPVYVDVMERSVAQ